MRKTGLSGRISSFLLALRAGSAVVAGVGALVGCTEASPEPAEPTLSVVTLLGSGGVEGFEQALRPRPFDFPGDHGPHPEFKTEWWYWAGHLVDSEDRRFGYQLTFFRSALSPMTPMAPIPPMAPPKTSTDVPKAAPSDWATDNLYMAHFALTDIRGERFRSFERFSRGAAGLAGAAGEPFRVWLDDWQVRAQSDGLRLEGREDDIGLDLVLDKGKPIVFHGDMGLSRKAKRPGAASYYYSYTRMPTRGTVTIDGESYRVEGSSWLDREWSSNPLDGREAGWDWFGAQLEDGREIMLFRLRDGAGNSTHSDGTLVDANGSSRPVDTADLDMAPLATWTSEETGIAYPSGFKIYLPAEAIRLELRPDLADQELRDSFVYWEGTTSVSGTIGDVPVKGLAYLELTGYGKDRARGWRSVESTRSTETDDSRERSARAQPLQTP